MYLIKVYINFHFSLPSHTSDTNNGASLPMDPGNLSSTLTLITMDFKALICPLISLSFEKRECLNILLGQTMIKKVATLST